MGSLSATGLFYSSYFPPDTGGAAAFVSEIRLISHVKMGLSRLLLDHVSYSFPLRRGDASLQKQLELKDISPRFVWGDPDGQFRINLINVYFPPANVGMFLSIGKNGKIEYFPQKVGWFRQE